MKMKDVTPLAFSCWCGGCPVIYETDRGTFLIIGSKVESPEKSGLLDKIGQNEEIIEVPAGLIREITTK